MENGLKTKIKTRMSTGTKILVAAVAALTFATLGTIASTLYFALRPDRGETMMENVYQSNFYRLTAAMDGIEENMAILTIASSPESQQKIANRIWRQTGEAGAALSGLPVNHYRLTDSYVLLNRLGGYLYSLSEKLSGGETFSVSDRSQIDALYKETALVTAKLDELRENMADYRFFDHLDPESTSPLGYAMDDCACPEIDYLGEYSSAAEARGYDGIERLEETTADAALEKVKAYLPVVSDAAYTGAVSDGSPASYLYNVGDGMLELTVHGGLIANLTMPSADGEADFQADDARKLALDFVKNAYGEKFETLQTRALENTVTVCTAPVEEGIVFENRAVSVEVDLVSGRICGVNALLFLGDQAEKQTLSPALSAAEAAMRVHSSLTDQFVRLALVRRGARDRLVYEFTGKLNDRAYMVRIDAVTGSEIDVLRLSPDTVL